MSGKNMRKRGDRADYFTVKKAKLSEQFLEHQKTKDKPQQIFLGIHFYINGYTVPPAEELKIIIVNYGGVYSAFLDSSVTHMVGNNLPDSKIKLLKKIKVVRPEWILDSVKQGKLLNCSEYFAIKDRKCIWNPNEEKNKHSSDRASNCLTDVYVEGALGKSVVKIPEETASSDKNRHVVGADINSYYSKSRLHFLSTMKMELRVYIGNLKKEKNHSFSGLERLRNRVKESSDFSLINYEGKSSCVIGETSPRVIIHIDMDSYFVSVSRCGRPELKGIPVVVTSSKIASYGAHYEIKDSMADIACCSYEARAAGVRNGMRMGKALQICPKLVAIPYEFEKYRAISYKFYEIVASYTLDLEAVSCDELYIDCTSALIDTKCSPLEFAEHIRQDIKEKTGCSASAGLGANRIQARLATSKAKPDGTFYFPADDVKNFMENIPLRDLPGVGPSLSKRLSELNLSTCGQVYAYGLSRLEEEFGPATGKTLYRHCQGHESHSKEDHNSLERKSVSSEINYGIRFTCIAEAEETIINLSKVVSSKLGSLQGKSIMLKLKVRSSDAPMTSAKFLGHGLCDNFCRTVTIDNPTADPDVISKVATDLLKKSKIIISDIRGIGVMMNKLEENLSKQKKVNIKKFFKPFQEEIDCQVKNEEAAIYVEDNTHVEGFVGKTSDFCHPKTVRSFTGDLTGDVDPIQLIENVLKSCINIEKPPDQSIRNKILCLLLNEVAQLNISFVIIFLRELKRILRKNITNPKMWKVWVLMFEDIRTAVNKAVSKVVGYPIKDFPVFVS